MRTPIISIVACAAVAMGLLSCSGHEEKNQSGAHEAEEMSVTSVHLDSIDRVRLGIKTAVINPDTFRTAVKVAGEVLPSSTDSYQIAAPGTGVIRFSTDLVPGMKLAAGQTVARIDASAVSGGGADRGAAAEAQAAKREYERVQSLRAEGLATNEELLAARGRYESAGARVSAKAVAGTVTSPAAGVVTEVLVSNGQFVSPGQAIATMASGNKLTLRVDVPERYAALLKDIGGMNVRVAGEDMVHSIGSGEFSVASGRMFSDSRGYIPLSVSFDNPGIMRTGVFADVYLLGKPMPGALSVPREAMIEDQGAYFVYVMTDGHTFERRRVETGDFNGSRVLLLSGLKAGECVAVKEVPMLRMAQSISAPAEGRHHH